MDTRLTHLETTEKPNQTEREIGQLATLTVAQLRARHDELFREPARSHHKTFLVRQIAWRLQAQREGGLPEKTRQLALGIAREAPLRLRIQNAAVQDRLEAERTATTRLASRKDNRLPMPGSLLVKEHQGETHVVRVLDDAFDYNGRLYRSLSAIALEITGTKWNGYTYFGLGKEVPRGRR
jgi:hypothetical protein